MTDADKFRQGPITQASNAHWSRLPGRAIVALAEAILSRRVLAMAFLAMAAVLVTAGWLHPAISRDISLCHIPLGVMSASLPNEILTGPRHVPLDSAGVVLLALVAVGAAIVLARPAWFAPVAGSVLCGAMAANATAAFNHPALIELMDIEYEQQQNMTNLLMEARQKRLADFGTARVIDGPAEGDQRGDLRRGWAYLLYGRWLVFLAAVAILLADHGPLHRRLMHLSAAALLGASLSGVLCFQRLRAEYYWMRANRLEAQCDDRAACKALDAAVAACPELERLERTWLLAGKLHYRVGQSGPEERFFRAYQLARDKEWTRTTTCQEDLPWLYRERQSISPGGRFFGMAMPPVVSTPKAYQLKERRQACALMDALVAEEGTRQPAVQNQAARLWTQAGLARYRQDPLFTDSNRDLSSQQRQFGAARAAWRKASALSAAKANDCALYLGLLGTRMNPADPQRVETEFGPLLARLADRALRSDLLAILGDSYFAAGRFMEARRHYAESCDALTLPKTRVNHPPLKGLGGL